MMTNIMIGMLDTVFSLAIVMIRMMIGVMMGGYSDKWEFVLRNMR